MTEEFRKFPQTNIKQVEIGIEQNKNLIRNKLDYCAIFPDEKTKGKDNEKRKFIDPFYIDADKWYAIVDKLTDNKIADRIGTCGRAVKESEDIKDSILNLINTKIYDKRKSVHKKGKPVYQYKYKNTKELDSACKAIDYALEKNIELTENEAFLLPYCDIWENINEFEKNEVCPISNYNSLYLHYGLNERKKDVDIPTGKIIRYIEKKCFKFPMTKDLYYPNENNPKIMFRIRVNDEPDDHGRVGKITVFGHRGKHGIELLWKMVKGKSEEEIREIWNQKERDVQLYHDTEKGYAYSRLGKQRLFTKYIINGYGKERIQNELSVIHPYPIALPDTPVNWGEMHPIMREVILDFSREKTCPILPDLEEIGSETCIWAARNMSMSEQEESAKEIEESLEKAENPEDMINEYEKFMASLEHVKHGIVDAHPRQTLFSHEVSNITGWIEHNLDPVDSYGTPVIDPMLANMLYEHIAVLDKDFVKKKFIKMVEGYAQSGMTQWNWLIGWLENFGTIKDLMTYDDYIYLGKVTNAPMASFIVKGDVNTLREIIYEKKVPIKIDSWDDLKALAKDTEINVEKILEEALDNKHFNDLDINNHTFLKDLNLRNRDTYNLSFTDVKINPISSLTLTGGFLHNSTFTRCTFKINAYNTNFENSKFVECNLKNSSFSRARLKDTIFQDCDLRGANLNFKTFDPHHHHTFTNCKINSDTVMAFQDFYEYKHDFEMVDDFPTFSVLYEKYPIMAIRDYERLFRFHPKLFGGGKQRFIVDHQKLFEFLDEHAPVREWSQIRFYFSSTINDVQYILDNYEKFERGEYKINPYRSMTEKDLFYLYQQEMGKAAVILGQTTDDYGDWYHRRVVKGEPYSSKEAEKKRYLETLPIGGIINQYKEETGAHAFWLKRPNKSFLDWLRKNKLSESLIKRITVLGSLISSEDETDIELMEKQYEKQFGHPVKGHVDNFLKWVKDTGFDIDPKSLRAFIYNLYINWW